MKKKNTSSLYGALEITTDENKIRYIRSNILILAATTEGMMLQAVARILLLPNRSHPTCGGGDPEEPDLRL